MLREVSRAGHACTSRPLGAQARPRTASPWRGGVPPGWGSAGRTLAAGDVKSRLVKLKPSGSRAVATHLRYLVRDGVAPDGTPDGTPGQAYDA